MYRYDADRAPKAEDWLALDEAVRIRLVEDFHRRERVKLPSLKAHAVFHVIVENQLAENLEPVVDAMARLTAQRLTRHQSLHAIASVLATHIHGMLSANGATGSAQADYLIAVENLTAESWLGQKP